MTEFHATGCRGSPRTRASKRGTPLKRRHFAIIGSNNVTFVLFLFRFVCFISWALILLCALILSETLALYKSFTYLLTYMFVSVVLFVYVCLSVCFSVFMSFNLK